MQQFTVITLIYLCIFISWTQATLKFIFLDDNPLQPCKMREEMDIGDAFDLSNLKFTRSDDDDKLLWSGSLKATPRTAGIKIPIMLRSQQKVRGIWTDSVIKGDSEDFCDFLFSDLELFREMFEKITPRTCPFDANTEYVIPLSPLATEFDIDYDVEGVFKFIIEFGPPEKPLACITFKGEILH